MPYSILLKLCTCFYGHSIRSHSKFHKFVLYFKLILPLLDFKISQSLYWKLKIKCNVNVSPRFHTLVYWNFAHIFMAIVLCLTASFITLLCILSNLCRYWTWKFLKISQNWYGTLKFTCNVTISPWFQTLLCWNFAHVFMAIALGLTASFITLSCILSKFCPYWTSKFLKVCNEY